MNTIKALAHSLAEEISERRVYNIPEIETMIYVQVKSSLREILNEQLTVEEREYTKALELQSTLRVGCHEYLKNGYKIATLKQKKSSINRSLAELRKGTANSIMKEFIKEHHGAEVLLEVLNGDKYEEKEA